MKYFFIICFAFGCFYSFGQNFETIRYFNKYNELSSDIIYNIEEDNNGFFWISTDNGILKFNGNKFKKLSTENGLPSNDIFKINIDSKNRIWLTGYFYGLYYIQNDKVFKIKNSEKYNTLEFLYENKDTIFFKNHYFDNISYVSKSNILKDLPLNKEKTRLMCFNDANTEVYKNLKSNSFFLIENKKKINVPNGYIFYPNLSTTYPTFVKDNSYKKHHSSNRIINNDVIFFKNNKWYKLKNDSKDKIKILCRDVENKYMILYDFNNKISVYKNNVLDAKLSVFLSELPIELEKTYFIFIDTSSNIWTITNDNQLIFIPDNYKLISTIKNQKIYGEKNTTIKYGLYSDDKYFLIDNNHFFSCYNFKSQKYQVIDSFKDEIPNKILDNKGELILCTNKYHYYYDKENHKLKEKTQIEGSKNSKIINNEIFYVTGGKVKCNEKLIFNIKHTFRFKDFIKIKDKYYCSNENHIICKSLKQTNYIKRDLKFINVIEKYEDKIIAGTNSNGIYILDENLNCINKVFNNENICDIEIKNNIIYALTTKSLFIYHLINNKIKLFKLITINDGIIDSRNMNLNVKGDNIYIFSQFGISIINKKDLKLNSSAVIDFECSEFSLNESNKIVLDRENNTLNFIFNVKTFENENSFKKYIQLKKANTSKIDKWELIRNSNFTFKDLSPGDYALKLMIKSDNYSFKGETKVIRFQIKPYYWETNYFKIIIIILFLLTLFVAILYFNYRRKMKYKLILKMNELELKALKSQMNPHFIFNILNSLQSIVFTKDEIEINKYFVKFSRLLRTTLEILNSDKVSLKSELDYLKSYIELEQLRSSNKFSYEILIDKDIDLSRIEIPVMLLQPIIENAIEHGLNNENRNNELSVEIKKNYDKIMVFITDNGNGMKLDLENDNKNVKEKSYAIKIIKDRIKILNLINGNKFKIEWNNLNKNNLTGTQVVFVIKI